MNQGILLALGAYFLWGFLPIYWKLLREASSLQILAHRIVWSLFFMVIALSLKKDWSWAWKLRKEPKVIFYFCAISALIAINWYTYIWGVNNNFIVETSLGYFINPLINVLLGVVFLKERPRAVQWVAIAFAFLGVSYLTLIYGRLPWVALILATSFGLYGLLKKMTKMGPLRGLTLETAILFPPALVYLAYEAKTGKAAFLSISTEIDILLVGAGIATSLPLLLFASAAKKITMTMLGLIQYVAPTMQFLIGIFMYKESFSSDQLIGFCLIWTALIIFSLDLIRSSRRVPRPAEF